MLPKNNLEKENLSCLAFHSIQSLTSPNVKPSDMCCSEKASLDFQMSPGEPEWDVTEVIQSLVFIFPENLLHPCSQLRVLIEDFSQLF